MSRSSVSVGKPPPEDKVVLVGSPGVGKSTIFQFFKTGKFVPADQLSHHGKADHSKQWTVSETKVSVSLSRYTSQEPMDTPYDMMCVLYLLQMTLYDTAGVERHTQTMLPTYFRRSKAIILVYSIDNEESFGDIGNNWLDNSTNADSKAQLVLVGNKVDLERERLVSQERALQYALINDIDQDMVFEISAKKGTGISKMFDAVALKMAPAKRPALEPVKEKPIQRNCSSC